MKKNIVSLIFILIQFNHYAQENSTTILGADHFLKEGKPVAQVLLAGSFHFAYYGLDAHKTKDENKVNVLSAERQKEMKELVEYIAQFKPTKIVVEGERNSGYILRRYERYLKNPEKNKANEIDQIAFPLMKQFGLDTLYGADSGGLTDELNKHKDSLTLRPIFERIFKDYDFRSDDEFSKRYSKYYDYLDELLPKMSLLEYFKLMNQFESYDKGYGAYLVGDFKNGSYEGSDALALYWYSRNLRIFRNIQEISTPEDRVLVIFGAGHMTILKNLFECSPEFDLARFNGLKE
ncbi:MAG: hypothetical protein JKY48_06535 [Flavobacteriales bacterium]|nr:hypothetical protein [Flavobacteriales bacterium]